MSVEDTKLYSVYVGKKHVDLVVATSEPNAIKIIEMNYGPSKVFSKEYQYVAVQEEEDG